MRSSRWLNKAAQPVAKRRFLAWAISRNVFFPKRAGFCRWKACRAHRAAQRACPKGRWGHLRGVLVRNFGAKRDSPMADVPGKPLEDMLRTIAIARLILGSHMNLQAPPNLSYADFPRLRDAGMNDWGGISPVTKDFI